MSEGCNGPTVYYFGVLLAGLGKPAGAPAEVRTGRWKKLDVRSATAYVICLGMVPKTTQVFQET